MGVEMTFVGRTAFNHKAFFSVSLAVLYTIYVQVITKIEVHLGNDEQVITWRCSKRAAKLKDLLLEEV